MARARILVDQNDPVTARFVTSLLHERGFEVVAPGADETLVEAARSSAPDLILTDLAPSTGDGLLLLQVLRADERVGHVPVVVLFTKDREEDIVRCFEDGADDCIVKPFRALELVARINRRLTQAGGRR